MSLGARGVGLQIYLQLYYGISNNVLLKYFFQDSMHLIQSRKHERKMARSKGCEQTKKKSPTSAANGTCVCWIHHFTFGSERIAGVYTKVLRANACSWKTISSPLPAPSIIQHPDWFCASVSEEYKYSQTVHGFQMFLNLWALWCALSLCVENSVIPCLWHAKIIEGEGGSRAKLASGLSL